MTSRLGDRGWLGGNSDVRKKEVEASEEVKGGAWNIRKACHATFFFFLFFLLKFCVGDVLFNGKKTLNKTFHI